jgi:hypothetical protein
VEGNGILVRRSIMRLAWLALVLLGGCGGCHGDPDPVRKDPAPAASASVAPSASVAVVAPAAPAGDPCEPFLKEQNASIDAALAHARKEAGASEPATRAMLPRGLPQCMRSAKGAWAVGLDSLVGTGPWSGIDGPPQMDGAFTLVHLDGAGKRTSLVPSFFPCDGALEGSKDNLCVEHFQETGSIELSLLGDYDGDGEDEVLVGVGQHGEERAAATMSKLFTASAGRVEGLARSHDGTIARVADVDGDGLPDLWLHPYDGAATVNCLGNPDEHVHGVEFLAHAQKGGTFTTGDTAALSSLAAVCPAKPKTLVAYDANGAVDQAKTGTHVVCALVRGASADEVTGALQRECATFDQPSSCAKQGPAKVCAPWLLEWAALAPPAHLR